MAKKKSAKPTHGELPEPLMSALVVVEFLKVGICPCCRASGKPKRFRRGGGFGCPYCTFEATAEDVRNILDDSAEFLSGQHDNFLKWRENRAASRKEV